MSVTSKYKLFRALCSKDEILLLYYSNGEGGGFMNLGGGLYETARFLMEKNDTIKKFILDAASDYLKQYEIQKQEFVKELYNQDPQ